MNLKISVRNNFGSSWLQAHGVVCLGSKFRHGGLALEVLFQCVARCHIRPEHGRSCGFGDVLLGQPRNGQGDPRKRLQRYIFRQRQRRQRQRHVPQGKSSTTSWSRSGANRCQKRAAKSWSRPSTAAKTATTNPACPAAAKNALSTSGTDDQTATTDTSATNGSTNTSNELATNNEIATNGSQHSSTTPPIGFITIPQRLSPPRGRATSGATNSR